MRQTLLRIRLDSYFSLEPVDGITAIGVGWLAVVVVPLFLWWLVRNREAVFGGRDGDALMSAVLGGGVSLAMLLAPLSVAMRASSDEVFASLDSNEDGKVALREFAKGEADEPTKYAFARIDGNEDEGITREEFAESRVPFLPIYGYGAMLFVGFLSAAWWAGTRSRAVGLPNEVIWDSCMWLFFGGILGARLWYLLQKHQQVFAKTETLPEVLFAIVNLPDGGLVLFGGIILGSVFFAWYCHRNGHSALLVGDVLIPSFFVGLGFGRLGCFMNGCCYGDTCSLPWAVHFPHGSVPFEALVGRGVIPEDAATSLALHPTQVYSAINAFLLAGLFHAYFRYRPRNGSVIALALMTYPITRFLLEILRADELGQLGTSLTISQWTSLALFPIGVLFQLWLSRGDGSNTPPSNAVAA